MGMAFWTEISSEPELGICFFGEEKSAENVISYLSRTENGVVYLRKEDLSIEPFDQGLQDMLEEQASEEGKCEEIDQT